MTNLLPVSQAAREAWIIMPCPICNVGKTERCRDTLGKPHPSMHPERRVWSTFTRSGEREPAPSSERELLREARDWLSSIGLPGGVTDDLRDRIDAYLASTTQEPAPSSERIDVAARAAYAAYCTTDPVDAEKQPDWGRDGYKAEAGVWQAVAAAVLASTTQEPAPSSERELLREALRYLDVAAGEGEVRNGVDAADLHCAIDTYLASTTQEPAPSSERELRAALEAVLPYVSTEWAGCKGDKCRMPTCYSCFGEDAAEVALGNAEAAYALAREALASTTQEPALDLHKLEEALKNAKWLLEGVKRAGWVTNPSFGDDINLGLERIDRALKGGEQ